PFSFRGSMAEPITVLIDADACPVKDEVYRVAARYGIRVFVVANAFIHVPNDPLIARVVVPAGADAADDWIAPRATPATVVITNDIPLADRAVKKGATVLAANGRVFSEASIGAALATRNLMEELRSAGQATRGPRPFARQDRSAFLQALDAAIV